MPKLLIPLDGSRHAELAVGPAVRFANALGLDLELIAVHPADEEFWSLAGIDATSELAQRRAWLERYLVELGRKAPLAGRTTSWAVRDGEVVEQLLAAMRQPDVDGVVIATTGRTGFSGVPSSSVADRLIRSRTKPVLVVPPHAEPYGGDDVIVALDGSAVSEAALPVARRLAAGLGVSLHLIQVVDAGPAWWLSEAAMHTAQSGLAAAAEAYLRSVAAPNESTAALGGHILDALQEYAEDNGCGYVVMATHGRTGPERLELGSVADMVVRGLGRPVLLVPIPATSRS